MTKHFSKTLFYNRQTVVKTQSLPLDSSSQPFFKTPHKSLKFQENVTATEDKWCTSYDSVIKKSDGNAFATELETYISKSFTLIPTLGGKPHGDSELSKQ